MKKIIPLLLLFFLFSTYFFSQERGFKVVAKTADGEIIKLYKECHALVIGVSDYLFGTGWPDLPNAVSDADEVGDLLENIGFVVTRVKNPTRAELNEKLEELVYGPGNEKDNCLVIFFAGHGHTERYSYGDEMGYIVPRDAPSPNRDKPGFMKKAINMRIIETFARDIQAKHALFLFDSCFSGAIFNLSRAIPPEYISDKTAKPVRQFITSGSADETVPDESMFKRQLIEALQGEADRNKDGYVTGTELGEFLHEKVLMYSEGNTPQYGKIKDPDLDRGDFVFVLESKKVAIPVEGPKPTFPKKSEKLDLSSIEESTRQREEVLKRWDEWQNQMNSDFRNVENIDKNPVSTREEKKAAWGQFLRHYDENNPYTTKDEELRQRAEQRIKELSKVEITVGARISLRSTPRSLSVEEVKSLLKRRNFFDSNWNKSGDFLNDFESRVIDGDKVVLDHATGLMWHQSGSEKYTDIEEAKEWIDELNRRGYAGYQDWRLPTLEEAASLLDISDSRKMNGLSFTYDMTPYINPKFSKKQKDTWTSDMVFGEIKGWVVSFYTGSVSMEFYDPFIAVYVRPVRSIR